MSSYVEWGALANIVVVGLLVGAGLPALFAVGVRAIAGPGARTADGRRSLARVTLAVVSFAVVVAAIAVAIVVIAAGGH